MNFRSLIITFIFQLFNSLESLNFFPYLRENFRLMFKLWSTFTLLLVALCTYAQDTTIIVPRYNILEDLSQSGENGGEVRIHSDAAVENLLKWHTHNNEIKKSYSGYRIQIHSVNSYGCNIDELKEIRNKFEETFETIPAYLKYFDPDFKIRVGNYHSRLESIPDLYRIRKLYPSSYPVKTEITLEELKRIPMQDIPVTEPQE